jgi:curved DNA-binding protein CbpA
MSFNNDPSLYDILEIKPDASPQEVREAYLRTKAAYGKDSVALYTLISVEEREDMLTRIQQAYDVLSNSDLRKDYDLQHGLLEMEVDFNQSMRPTRLNRPEQKIISIDRVPPMENSADSENLLVAPTTDFDGPHDHHGLGSGLGTGSPFGSETPAHAHSASSARAPAPDHGSSHVSSPLSGPMSGGPATFGGTPTANPVTPAYPAAATQPPAAPTAPSGAAAQPPTAPSAVTTARAADLAIQQEISQETEWKGPFLRRIREFRRISIEEMANITKVSKTYLMAIEEENFGMLPAPVFLRGFVTQIAKTLKLPHEAVALAYMARVNLARPEGKR